MKNYILTVILLMMLSIFIAFAAHIMMYPEKYSTTLKYQLKCDLERGDVAAAEYYQTNYVDKGVKLFSE